MYASIRRAVFLIFLTTSNGTNNSTDNRGDAESVTAIYTPIVEQTHISFETHPPTIGEMAQRIQNTVERLPWLVCEYNGQITGYAYASPHKERTAYQWAVDVSVYVNEVWRRKGIASALYESLFALLDLQGLCNAYAVIALPNPQSVTFHEHMVQKGRCVPQRRLQERKVARCWTLGIISSIP